MTLHGTRRRAALLNEMQARYLSLPIDADIGMYRDIPIEELRSTDGEEIRPPWAESVRSSNRPLY